MKRVYVLVSLLLFLVIFSCKKDYNQSKPISKTLSPATNTYASDNIRNYFSLMCTITKSTKGFFPPQAARAYGYIGIAAYEAVRPGIAGAISLSKQVNGLKDLPEPSSGLKYNWAISSNAAIAEMMRKMFELKISPANLNTIDSVESANLNVYSKGEDQNVIDRSVQFGKGITAGLYLASTTDGGHQSYLDPFQLPYALPATPGSWVPTGAITTPIAPYWGNNRPFLTNNVNIPGAVAPLEFSTDTGSAFYKQAMAVYTKVKNNTADEIEITKFWADDPFNTCTPAGHTFNILVQLLKENKATLEKASVAFAKLSIAENDAFIGCWKGKYKYNMIRPVSYIKKYIDPAFSTVIGTPPFPSYCAGHAYESGAASTVFTNLFADNSGNYDFTDYSQLQYGFTARHFTNFNDMALECANSRFYGGIHYMLDTNEGLKQGKIVGDNVNKLIIWPIGIK